MKTRTEHTSREEKRAENLAKAQAAYKEKRAAITDRILRIQRLVAKHGPTDDDQLFWGFVGDLEHVDGRLKDIEDFLSGYPDEK